MLVCEHVPHHLWFACDSALCFLRPRVQTYTLAGDIPTSIEGKNTSHDHQTGAAEYSNESDVDFYDCDDVSEWSAAVASPVLTATHHTHAAHQARGERIKEVVHDLESLYSGDVPVAAVRAHVNRLYAAHGARFTDPLVTALGKEAIVAQFLGLRGLLSHSSLRVDESILARDASTLILIGEARFTPRFIAWCIDMTVGVTVMLRLDEEFRVTHHTDQWSARDVIMAFKPLRCAYTAFTLILGWLSSVVIALAVLGWTSVRPFVAAAAAGAATASATTPRGTRLTLQAGAGGRNQDDGARHPRQ